MAEIPDAWPPPAGEIDPNAPIVPMFPLPGVFLYPRQLMPLNIFEPRYRQMVEDSLDGPGRITVATVLNNQSEEAEVPAVLPIAGLGEIGRHESLPDGRYVIWLVGLGRVRLEEVDCQRLYRKARVEPLDELAASPHEEEILRTPLTSALIERAGGDAVVPDDLPMSVLVDLLCQRTEGPRADLERIYSEPDVARRAEAILEVLGAG